MDYVKNEQGKEKWNSTLLPVLTKCLTAAPSGPFLVQSNHTKIKCGERVAKCLPGAHVAGADSRKVGADAFPNCHARGEEHPLGWGTSQSWLGAHIYPPGRGGSGRQCVGLPVSYIWAPNLGVQIYPTSKPQSQKPTFNWRHRCTYLPDLTSWPGL